MEEYRLLGPVEVRRRGAPVDLGVYKQRALLAVLLINANRVVSVDRLIEDIWATDAGSDRQNALWVNISRLRSVLEPDREKRAESTVLITRPPGYLLSLDASSIDSVRFEQLSDEGRALIATDPERASQLLGEALALWRGRALEEFTYEPFADAEIARLEELRLNAVEDRVSADLASGRARDLVGELESLVRTHPLRERLTAHLMLALYRSGRQGDALRAYAALEARMGEELGLEPSRELSMLEEQVVLDDPALSAPAMSSTKRGVSGLSVRGYEIRHLIGTGTLGDVYTAFQPAVGREVAIKVIRSDLANDPDFIRRFEAQAQVATHLDHPQIVPIFDYWREPDAAFLVTQRFEGGNLRQAITADRPGAEEGLRLLAQIAGAIGSAHRRGEIHGDLKPENVLLDRDGNAYVTDFGVSHLAGAVDTDSLHTQGSMFSAPELGSGGQPTAASDVFSLGALARFALGDSAGAAAGEVQARATAVDPVDRFATVEELLDALRAALGQSVPDPQPGRSDAANPYRGLRAFEEDDADRFFGRERLIERLLARLGHSGRHGRFVAVVGPSGSGKSSVVRAGVVPALRGGAVVGSDRWFVVTMTPGRRPFEELEDAIRTIAVNPPANLIEQLTSLGIGTAVRSLLPDPESKLVVVVDQMEELFSLASPRTADAFLAALAANTFDKHSQVAVIATLRADFYDRPLRHAEFGEVLRLGTEVITPMMPEELERAISAPAAEVGVMFEPGLVAAMVSDMSGQSTALPLMQYALTELFEQRSGNVLKADSYRGMGGLSAALARRVDTLYEGLDAADRVKARDVLLRLVNLNERSADTRRRALLSELDDGGRRDLGEVLDVFGRHRLLTFDRDVVTRAPTVEIAHEALLTEWDTLSTWLDETRADIGAQRRLAVEAAEWHDRGRDGDFLLMGARLTGYDGWLDDPPVRLTVRELEYLEASHTRAESELEADRSRVRRLRLLVSGIGIALVLALAAGGLAFSQRQAALHAAADAELATLISRSAAAIDDDPDLALLLALEAHRRQPEPASNQAVLGALGGATIGNRVVSRPMMADPCLGGGSFFPQQFHGTLELAVVDGRMLSREPVTNQITDMGPAKGPCTVGADTGTIAAVGSLDGSKIWTGDDLELELEFEFPTFLQVVTPDRLLVWSQEAPDAPRGTVSLLDTSTGATIGEPITDRFIFNDTVSSDYSLIAFGVGTNEAEEGTLYVMDAESGEILLRRDFPGGPIPYFFDDATGDLIVGFNRGRIVALDIATGELGFDFTTGHVTGYHDAGMRPGGEMVLVGQGTIDVVDPRTGLVERSIELQNVRDSFVRPDGLVLTIDNEAQIDVYDLDASVLVEKSWDVDSFGHVAMVDGRAAMLNRSGDFIEIIDLHSGEREQIELRTPDGADFDARIVYPEPDGAWAVSSDLVLARWEGPELAESIDLAGSDGATWIPYGRKPAGTRFGDLYAVLGKRPDGSRLATLARMRPGEAAVLFTIDTDAWWVHPTGDGGLYTIDLDGTLHTYDPSGDLVGELEVGVDLAGADLDPYAVTMNRAGTKLAIPALAVGGVYVVDLPTGEVDIVPGRAIASTLGFNPDGSLLVMAMFDGSVRLHDVEGGGVPPIVWDGSGAFDSEPGWYDEARDSMWMMSGGKLLEIPLSPDRWVERACEVVGRDITQEEWDLYVPGDQAPSAACELTAD